MHCLDNTADARVENQIDFRFWNIQALIVKVTQRCNLNCQYCYEKVSTHGDDMPVATFKKLVDSVLTSSVQPKVLFIFHGGEPTLVPTEWYVEAVEYCNLKASENNKIVSYALQSNVLAINPDKLTAFKELRINVSVSVDGPLIINKTTLRGQDDLTIRNIKKLKALGLNIGVLATINPINYSRFPSIMEWLYDELGIKSLKANVMYAVGAGYNMPDLPDDNIYAAQEDILNYMIDTKGKKVVETNLYLEIKRFLEQDRSVNKMSLCDDRVCGAGKRVFGVNLKGELLPCGRFEWNDEKFKLGDLDDVKDLEAIEDFKTSVSEFHDQNPETWLDCNKCEAKRVCRYSCQAFIVRSRTKRNVECIAMKKKYKFFLNHREELLEIYNNVNAKSENCKFEDDQYLTELLN